MTPYRASPPAPAVDRRSRALATLARWMPVRWRWVRRARGGHWDHRWNVIEMGPDVWVPSGAPPVPFYRIRSTEDHGPEVAPYRLPRVTAEGVGGVVWALLCLGYWGVLPVLLIREIALGRNPDDRGCAAFALLVMMFSAASCTSTRSK